MPGKTTESTQGTETNQTTDQSVQDSAAGSKPKEQPKTKQTETIVEQYPAGMTVEQMKKSNPDAVAQIEKAAVAAAQVKTPASIDDLKAAFPNNPQIALDAVQAGLTVMEAKAGQYDVLVKTVSTLTEENTKLKADGVNGHVEFTEGGDSTKVSTEDMSDDQLENAAVQYWNSHESVRAEHPTKQAFVAYFKNRPEEFQN